MSAEQSFTFYTYATSGSNPNDRWADPNLLDSFFPDEEAARQDALALRKEIIADDHAAWSPLQLELIETLPMTKHNTLLLLNRGVSAVVKRHAIIGIIE